MLPILRAILLNCIVSEMHEFVVKVAIVSSVFFAAGANVALSEDEAIQILSDHNPYPYVEFPAIYQHRVFDILLNNELMALEVFAFFQFSLLGLRRRLLTVDC